MTLRSDREDLTRQLEAETTALAVLAEFAERLEDAAKDVRKAAASKAKHSPLTRQTVDLVVGRFRDYEAAVDDLWIARHDLATARGEHA